MNEAQNQRRALLIAKKINSETHGGNPAKSYQHNWAWLSWRVERLRNLCSFQSVLFLLEGTKLKVSWLKTFSQFNWMSELDASLCRQRVRRPTIIISQTYEEKQKVCSSIHELERWFWRKSSMSETDYTYNLARRTRGKFYLPSIGFPLQEHLRARKSQYQNWEEAQLKIIKKTELENRDESNDYAFFGLFNLSCFC